MEQKPDAPETGEESEAEPAPASKPTTRTVQVYHFDLDVVFQTLYELCTNETVKDHIKAMRADQEKVFTAEAVSRALSDLAPDTDAEDNFYNFPITAILKILFQASTSDQYKQVLKKMNQTAGSIFLDQILPIEGTMEEKEEIVEEAVPPPEVPEQEETSDPAQASGLPAEKIQELLTLIDENIGLIREEIDHVGEDSDTEGDDQTEDETLPTQTAITEEDHHQIVNVVRSSDEIIKRIISHITRIMESLSFQDLSGQRILKIVRLISNVQLQLLSLLVSFGAKLKKKQEEESITSTETEGLAQQEVDKMMERVTASSLKGPASESRLDQDAVDNMLAEMGF